MPAEYADIVGGPLDGTRHQVTDWTRERFHVQDGGGMTAPLRGVYERIDGVYRFVGYQAPAGNPADVANPPPSRRRR